MRFYRGLRRRAATACGGGQQPTDAQSLTDEQASKGVQFFFRPQYGYIEATFSVSYNGAGSCTGRNLMFAGDSALCAPPPPMPPLPPPSPLPHGRG